jgi:hypothetical protein
LHKERKEKGREGGKGGKKKRKEKDCLAPEAASISILE